MLSSPVLAEETRHDGLRQHVFVSRCTSLEWAYRAAVGARVLHAPPGRPAFVGQGEAVVLRGDPLEVARAAQRPSAALRSEAPVRFVGGFAFDRTQTPDGPWQGFPLGHFVCPRLQWTCHEGQAQIVVVASAHESRGDIEAEVAAFENRALRDAGPNARSVHATLAAAAAHNTVLLEDTSASETWKALVRAATTAVAAGVFEKVVAARSVRAESKTPFDTASLIEALGETPATRFALDIAGATFLGASPELLVRKSADVVSTEALAGSEPRTGHDDQGEIERLLASQKDRQEHRFVVQAIEAALAAFVRELRVPAEPHVRTLPTVHHLQRSIEGSLSQSVHVLELVAALHPTPAVCGTPREAARSWLREHEGMSRGYYAGPVGWFDTFGDGEFHVALRSALVRETSAWLFAGAGLVAGSEPERELAEVQAKLQVMKRALGVVR